MTRRLLALFAVMTLGLALTARAEDQPAAAPSSDPAQGEKQKAFENQQILERQFREFEASLLRLEQRLAHSSKPEDRERAANLKKALDIASQSNADTTFEKLINILKSSSKELGMRDIEQAMTQNQMLAEDIRAILMLLLTDNRDDEIKREKERLANLIKALDKAIRDQKLIRTHTESQNMDPDALAKLQNKAGQDTADIAKAMGKNGKDGKNDKSSENKDNDNKGKDSKGEGKDSKGEGKDSKGEGKDSKGEGKDSKGEGKDSKGGGKDSKGQGQEGGQQSPEGGDKSQSGEEATPGQKQVQDANKYQQKAEDQIKKQQPDEASKNQGKAIEKLDEAKKKLEEILRQLREEEVERILAALQARCEHMLQMQIAVHEGTVRLDEVIATHADKKADRGDEQKSLQLSDHEGDIVKEADKAIQLLQAEGSAVAFPEVFIQVREDMKHVTRRLGKVDVGNVTQVIEKDIIATLKDMVDALKQQRQQMEAQKGQPQPPGQGEPQPQSLVNLLAELKMIRAMQIRVNTRTLTYANEYVDKEGEQTKDPDIQKELRDLSDRQAKIFEVTNNIYRRRNR